MITVIDQVLRRCKNRHLDPAKDETIVCLRGHLGVVVFCPSGAVDRNYALAPASGVSGGLTPAVRLTRGLISGP
jgi:hypothetical protein